MTAAGGWVIDAEDVGKSFGRARVLRGVSVQVAAGEGVVVLGPNGAGKSTWLRLCAGVQQPTEGVLRLFGSAARHAGVRRRIGVMAHQSFLYGDLTAGENLVFYARLYRLAEPARVARHWLARVGLGAVAATPVRVLSRGMEQRLALARALLHEPELLLLDEPWSGLDAEAAAVLSSLLAELRRGGRTVVVATHDLDRGLAIADRALILHRGRLAAETPVDGDAVATVGAMYRRVTSAVAA